MEGLTREQAIKNHREFWNWIADETKRTSRCVTKTCALAHFGLDYNSLNSGCWLCTYNKGCCVAANECLLQWPGGRCVFYDDDGEEYSGLYHMWCEAISKNKVKLAVRLARKIANLPESEVS